MGQLVIPDAVRVYIDTPVVIYTVEGHPDYYSLLQPLWLKFQNHEITIVSSELTLMEVLIQPIKNNDETLREDYETILLLSGIEKFTPLQALALANPKPTPQELKGTEVEADYLMQNFPGSQDYRGEKATLDTFKTYASRFPILHLGTHGCFDQKGCCLREKLEDCPPKQPDMKANTILFANNQQYPIAEAALLGLKDTEIIVIAACQTAQITEVEGVGLSGLAYIWERAGAKSLIASLWNAADVESSEIMKQFYGNLKQGMSKAEAMRQAKLKLIDQHPFFWSPFILIGDAQ